MKSYYAGGCEFLAEQIYHRFMKVDKISTELRKIPLTTKLEGTRLLLSPDVEELLNFQVAIDGRGLFVLYSPFS